MGMPHLATVVVPHPVGEIAIEEVIQKAEEALEEMVEAVTMARDELAARPESRS